METKLGRPKALNAKEICELVEVCGKNGVIELSYSGLQIKFQMDEVTAQTCKASVYSDPQVSLAGIADDTDANVDEEAPYGGVELTAEQAEEFEKLTLSQLMVENPAAYEQRIIDQAMESDYQT